MFASDKASLSTAEFEAPTRVRGFETGDRRGCWLVMDLSSGKSPPTPGHRNSAWEVSCLQRGLSVSPAGLSIEADFDPHIVAAATVLFQDKA